MFPTLCALPKGSMRFIKHVFACAVRPPHLLKRRGEFEDNLVYDMMLHKEFDIRARHMPRRTKSLWISYVTSIHRRLTRCWRYPR